MRRINDWRLRQYPTRGCQNRKSANAGIEKKEWGGFSLHVWLGDLRFGHRSYLTLLERLSKDSMTLTSQRKTDRYITSSVIVPFGHACCGGVIRADRKSTTLTSSPYYPSPLT